MKIAIILFPGTNCENETKLVVEDSGMEADIIRWNEDSDILDKYDGYVLPGGWSYEDRIRAGVISAKDPVMNKIKQQAMKGKPVIGICNGCQVLVESGLIPGVQIEEIEMALAPNINPKVSGFYCTWVNLKTETKKQTAFNIDIDEIIPMPIAHGEGRFTTKNKELLQQLKDNDQILFRYCDSNGNTTDEFPTNPNGSLDNIAGIVNKEGNVLAMMPHPERASFIRQLPDKDNSENMELPAPAMKIFQSMKKYIEERK